MIRFDEYPDIISIAQLRQILNISEATALKLVHSGKIKSNRVGRIHKIVKSSVLEYLSCGNESK